MMSFKAIAAGGANSTADYFESEAQVERDDYYTSEGDAGTWLGSQAERMGLAGSLRPGEIKAMLEGYNPMTGEAIASNAGAEHKCGWDIVFSAPKSVSLIWALSDPDTRSRIETAQARAASKAFDFLQDRAFSTRDRAGPEHVRDLVAAAFQHGTSRNGDPNLHVHILSANMAQDGRALDFDSRWKMAAGAIYRTELASQMQQLGYEIERDKSSFRLAGINPAHEKQFSTRRAQIVAELSKTGFWSAKASAIAVLSTRASKQIKDRQQQLDSWQRVAASTGLDLRTISGLRGHPPEARVPMPEPSEILKALTQQASTFTPHQLSAAVATEAQGKLDADQTTLYIKDMMQDRNLVYLKSASPFHRARNGEELRMTTREVLELERGIVDKALARRAERHSADPQKAIARAHACAMASGRANSHGDYGATPEQISMIRHVCTEPGAVKLVQGMAGTGKSFTLGIAKEAWEQSGYRVIGAALAGKAADGLQAGAGIQSSTLHSLLLKLDNGHEQLSKNDVIVIDEAGMLGSRLMARILDKAHEAGAKVVLVGDSDQLQPIDAGGAFRALTQHLGAVRLTDITRQHHEIDRQVVRDFASGNASDAIRSLDSRGLIKTNDDRQALLDHLVADWAAHRDPLRPGESLMIAATKADARKLNELARTVLQSQHRLTNETDIETASGRLNVSEGDRILFRKNDSALAIKNGQLATVQRIDVDRRGILMTLRTDAGRTVRIRPGMDAVHGEYADMMLGYCVTGHSSQGVTLDHAHILLHDAMSDREWSYVAASRARNPTRLYCTTAQRSEIACSMAISHQADFSADFVEIASPEGVTTPETATCMSDTYRRTGAPALLVDNAPSPNAATDKRYVAMALGMD